MKRITINMFALAVVAMGGTHLLARGAAADPVSTVQVCCYADNGASCCGETCSASGDTCTAGPKVPVNET